MGKAQFFTTNQGIATFTINRPEKRNAIDYDVMDELEKAITYAKEADNVKAFVITGAGIEAFCSGGDVRVFHELKTAKEAEGMLKKMGRILYELLTLPKPTVALLNGISVGGGCEIAIACDFRIGATHSEMGFIQGNLGITTGWGGGTILLEKLRHSEAMEMLYSAQLYSVERAKQIGFLSYVTTYQELTMRCEEWLLPLINKPIDVLKAYKQTSIEKWEQSGLWNRMENEINRCSVLWETEQHMEAVEQVINKKSQA
ncbi:enoyl-CoA hydratase/isomerase family protein [Priestia megaterium]|nr:enoyl-CoA hydratase/isomerase family protein [Priestia megaterium]